jgi:hypothetical protein
MQLRPGPAWAVPGRSAQALALELNQRPVASWRLQQLSPTVYAVGLVPPLLKQRNELRFTVPGPIPGHGDEDLRSIRTAVSWLRLDEYPEYPEGGIAFGASETDSYVGSGWSRREGVDYRWTIGNKAELYLGLQRAQSRILRLDAHAFLVPGRKQRVWVGLNGLRIASLELTDATRRVRALPVPNGLATENVLTLELPDAHSPQSAGVGADRRPLGLGVHHISLEPFRVLPVGRRIDWGATESEGWLGEGWTAPDHGARWTDGFRAEIAFAAEEMTEHQLSMHVEPFIVPWRPSTQRVRFWLNEEAIGELNLTGGPPRWIRLRLPRSVIAKENVLRLSLPDAAAPAAGGFSSDWRRLGVRVYAVELDRRSVGESTVGQSGAPAR